MRKQPVNMWDHINPATDYYERPTISDEVEEYIASQEGRRDANLSIGRYVAVALATGIVVWVVSR